MNKLIARLSPSGALRASLSVGKLTTPPALQNKTVAPAVQPQTVTFDKPYDGLGEVTVEGMNLQNKTVQPSVERQDVTFDEPFVGLGEITVEAVTASIDPNIIPANIVKDKEILGVVGTAETLSNLKFTHGYYLCSIRPDFIDTAIPALDKPTRMEYCFANCSPRSSIDLSSVDFSVCTGSWSYCFASNSSLEEVLGLDFSATSYDQSPFFATRYVKRITFQPGSTIGATSTTKSITIDLSYIQTLTEEALLEMLSTLGPNTTGKTRGFKINRGVYESLSQVCLEAFAAKNYTLTSSTSYSLRDPDEEYVDPEMMVDEEVIEEEVIE